MLPSPPSFPRRIRRPFALLLALSLTMPAVLYAHIRLESSAPARDEVLDAPPAQLRLRFSGRIEERYTSVTLTAPDGTTVPIGRVVFIEDSDREITVRVPPLQRPGTYTVVWRTAGADGHVLEGTYAFTVAGNGRPAVGVDTMAAVPAPVQDHAHHGEPEPAAPAAGAMGRGLHFGALLLLVGGVAFRVVLLPRLALADDTRRALERRAWNTVAAGAVLLAIAAVVRLWSQSVALHGAERAWSPPLLSIMLADTAWGRTWVFQAFLFAILGMAIAWARPGRDRIATVLAVPTVLALAAIPAFSGHAAGATGPGRLALLNDTLHVAAGGGWLGTLAVILLVAIPVIRRSEPQPGEAVARTIDAFSPVALTAAAMVALSGVINALMNVTAASQLWGTPYGRTLVLKIAFVLVVMMAGFINWRVVRPRLREGDATRRLGLGAGAELLFALLVIAATAVLTGLPKP